jgi:hypothetical protein
MGSSYELGLPLIFLGMDYPTDALLLAGALWGFILGLWFVITDAEGGRVGPSGRPDRPADAPERPPARLHPGGRLHRRQVHKDPTTVAVFGLMALAQAACGLILLILSIFERPKGIASLAFGAGGLPGRCRSGRPGSPWGGGP